MNSNHTPIPKPVIRISVGELIQYSRTSGHIRSTGVFQSGRLHTGIKVHLFIQKNRPDDYHSEVTVETTRTEPEFILQITGRMDGLIIKDREFVVEEIKSTYDTGSDLTENKYPDHWLQAQIYASIFGECHPFPYITIRLCYAILPNLEEKIFSKKYSSSEIQTIFESRISIFVSRLKTYYSRISHRDRTIRSMQFPFQPLRSGQEEMIQSVLSSLRNGRDLILQAPTGSGKTLAILYSAFKSLPDCGIDRIFYFSAKTTGKNEAEYNLETLVRRGLDIRTVTITAREKICLNPGAMCTPDECEYARQYYLKISGAVEYLGKTPIADTKSVIEAADLHQVCPFELSLDYSELCDVIVGDYNYLIDPSSRIQRYFIQKSIFRKTGNYVCLLDEAHNLPARASKNFSIEINREAIIQLQRRLKAGYPALYPAFKTLTKYLAELRSEIIFTGDILVEDAIPPELTKLLSNCISATVPRQDRIFPGNFQQELNTILFTFNQFLAVSDQWNDRYRCISKIQRNNITLKLFCVDPSTLLRSYVSRGGRLIYFSATLEPEDFYSYFLGSADTDRVEIQDVYSRENSAAFIVGNVSTRFRHRKQTISRICRLILKFSQSRQGNYFVFFPSYQYLQLAARWIREAEPNINILCQTAGMSEKEKQAFLQNFLDKSERSDTRIGFVITGGFFGEGINLPGDSLIGVVVVGTAHPAITIESELIRSYFDTAGENGYDFAYHFPSISAVLQSAGRLIRDDSDRGAILFIGDRFSRSEYLDILEKYWCTGIIQDIQTLQDKLEIFWCEE